MISRVMPGEASFNGAFLRAGYMCEFLKSLPEAGDMPILVALDSISNSDYSQNLE